MLKRSLEVDKEKFVFSMVLECCVEIELLKTGVAGDSFCRRAKKIENL
jgi:hypothetical protein